MIDRDLQKRIAVELADNYSKASAEAIKNYVQKFIHENMDLCDKEAVYQSQLDLATANKGMTKANMMLFLAIPFSSKKLLNAFRAFLPKNIRLILDELVWFAQLSNADIERQFGIIIYNEKHKVYGSGYKQKDYELKAEYSFFPNKGSRYYYYNNKADYTLYFTKDLCKLLCRFYDKPKEAVFNFVPQPEKTAYTYLGEEHILLELPRIIAYERQQQIKTTNKGKPQASTLTKMRKKLNLKEFYPEQTNKLLQNLRTGLLAGLITTKLKHPNVTETPDLLSKLIQHNYRNGFSSIHGILTYFKGTGHIDPYYERSIEPIFYTILTHLIAGKWISLTNLENYIRYNFYDINPVKESTARDRLYYTSKVEGERFTYDEKAYIDKTRYYRSVLLPFIKGTCFLFAAYGLLDIAYDTPDITELGKTAESPYDGLKYIRLNALGAFAMAKQDTYDMPDAIMKSSITLSDDSLTITIDEKDTTAPIILEPYTERVSPNRFRTDYAFFLKGAKNKTDLENKISLFKQSVKVEVPANWGNFFNELRQKIDPLKKVSNLTIFQIPQENKELLRLIAKDATLQKLCLKAEGYHIILTRTNLPKFKKRLQEFGYLIT